MFTGLVDHCGKVLRLERYPSHMTLWISTEFTGLVLGESIAIDGVCLTVTAIESASFACEVSPETLRLTHMNEYEPGRSINLERALSLQDRLGGHFVMGHIDQTLEVAAIEQHDDFWQINFSGVNADCSAYLTPKGSVAINGVSLTINTVNNAGFSVMLIPHTLERTNFKQLVSSQTVNVEYDHLAKCVARQLACYQQGGVK